jgi:hypothetical protein
MTPTTPDPSVTAITTDTGRAFAERQLAAAFSTATINKSLACLRRRLSIAREGGKLQSVPFEADQAKNATARVIPLPSVVAEKLSRIKPKSGTVFDVTNLRTEWAKLAQQ